MAEFYKMFMKGMKIFHKVSTAMQNHFKSHVVSCFSAFCHICFHHNCILIRNNMHAMAKTFYIFHTCSKLYKNISSEYS